MVAHVYSACGCACALSMPVDPGPDSRHAQLHEVLRSTSPMLLPLIVTVTQPSHSDGRKHSASRLIYLIVVSACNEVFATVRIIHAHILSKSSAQLPIRGRVSLDRESTEVPCISGTQGISNCSRRILVVQSLLTGVWPLTTSGSRTASNTTICDKCQMDGLLHGLSLELMLCKLFRDG